MSDFIKKFRSYINEELVHGFKKKVWKDLDDNLLKKLFRGNVLNIREFISSILVNQNLEFLGGGISGLSFKWKSPHKLDEDFTKNKFYGIKYAGPSVIKISPYEQEFNTVRLLMEKSGSGTIPGFVKYYWIKEILVPKNLQLSKILMGFNKKSKKKLLEDNPIIRMTYDSYRELEDPHKFEKFWIICMEELEMLDKKEIDLANFWKKIYQYNPVYFKNLTNEFNSNSLSLIYKLIKGNKINFFIKKLIGNKNSQVFFFKKILENTNVSIDEFIEFSSQLLKIYKTGFELGINIDDLHGDNLGRRGDELVAFDCTAPD